MHASYLARLDAPMEYAKWLKAAAPRIIAGPSILTIHIPQENLLKLIAFPPETSTDLPAFLPPPIPTTVEREGDRVVLSANISFKPRRGRSEIIDRQTGKEITARSTAPNPALIQTIAQAEFWRSEPGQHRTKPLERITAEYGIKPRYVRKLLNAAYLFPRDQAGDISGDSTRTLAGAGHHCLAHTRLAGADARAWVRKSHPCHLTSAKLALLPASPAIHFNFFAASLLSVVIVVIRSTVLGRGMDHEDRIA